MKKTRLALLSMVCAAAAATAQPSPPLAELSIERLRALYLHCDRESRKSALDVQTVTLCVSAGEQLRDRAHGGSFESLIAWWRSVREPVASVTVQVR